MSNVCYGVGGYFQVPNSILDILSTLSGNATKVYVFLMGKAHRHTAIELEFSDEEISVGTGVRDRKTLRKVQDELIRNRLVELRRIGSGLYAYVLQNRITGEHLPKPEGRSGIRRFRKGLIQDRKRHEAAQESSAPHQTGDKKTPNSPQRPNGTESKCRVHPNATMWYYPDDPEHQHPPVCSECHPEGPLATFEPPTAEHVGFVTDRRTKSRF